MTPHDDMSLDPSGAFRELARIEFSQHSIESVMTKISEPLKPTVAGADEVSVTFLEGDSPRTVAFTGQLAIDLDERQYERIHGPCRDSTAAGELASIPDMASDSRWRDWARTATEYGCASSLSVPVPLQRQLSAALNVYSRTPPAFDSDAQESARTFASYAGVAISDMHLYESTAKLAEQLDAAMQSRAVIEHAKGILMGQGLCSAEHAFNLLVDLSQRSNRKIRVVAEALVESAVPTDGADTA